MSEQTAKDEILAALARFHAAQKAGDLDEMVAAFAGIATRPPGAPAPDKPQGVSNGVPRSGETVRSYFQAMLDRNVYETLDVDMSRTRITVEAGSDASLGSDLLQRGLAFANATVEPVIYTTAGGRKTFMAYNMVKEEDGAWRIIHDQIIPDPDGEAYTRDLLADAGRVLDKLTMVWTRKLDVPVEKVWEAVSTKEGLQQWWLGRDAAGFQIDLKVGGVFNHHWRSTISEIVEKELIDFGEFRIELEPDGEGTVLTFIVFTLNGDEWRAFWRASYTPLYYAQFGGLDPWAASGWHHIIDRLEEVLTGRPLEHGRDSGEFAWQPSRRLEHFYLVYFRDLHRLEQLSKRSVLKPDWEAMLEGYPRSESEIDVDLRRDAAYQFLQPKVVEHSSQSVLVMEREVPQDELRHNVLEMLPIVSEHVGEQGGQPPGRPFVRILERSPDRVRFEVGLPAAADFGGSSDIERRELPGGKVVVTTSIPSQNLWPQEKWWPWVIRYAEEQGYALDSGWGGNGGWQVFVNDPAVVGEDKARSQLCLPVSG